MRCVMYQEYLLIKAAKLHEQHSLLPPSQQKDVKVEMISTVCKNVS